MAIPETIPEDKRESFPCPILGCMGDLVSSKDDFDNEEPDDHWYCTHCGHRES